MAEQILNHDPSSTAGDRLIVEAAKVLEMPLTAVMSLDTLFRHSPEDKEVAIQYATALAGTGAVGRAEQILAERYRANPSDNDLAQALKNLSARKTLDEGGYDALADGTGSHRNVFKDKEQAVALEQESRQVKTEDVAERLIREYESRLKTEPRNLKMMRSLAELSQVINSARCHRPSRPGG